MELQKAEQLRELLDNLEALDEIENILKDEIKWVGITTPGYRIEIPPSLLKRLKVAVKESIIEVKEEIKTM